MNRPRGATPDLTEPCTPAGRAARRVAERFYSPALLHHCLRSYHWGALRARRVRLVIDHELLYVAALLHDLGLVGAFDNTSRSFEHTGGDLAWVFGAAAGWDDERSAHAGRVVVDHMRDVPTPVDQDPEAHLLAVATALDISGTGVHAWPDEERSAVLEALPRLDLATEFAACFRSQASRKPGSSAARACAGGIEQRLARNPLDRPG
jgi:HD domain